MKSLSLRLNCDLAEGAATDVNVMPYIDQANIACGLHAGDPQTMYNTLAAAKQHQVAIGAHPGYADRENFGRKSMALSEQQIIQLIHYQLGALQGLTKGLSLRVEYVKPHGALYNDMMQQPAVRHAVMRAVSEYDGNLQLMVLADPQAKEIRQQARAFGLSLIFEVFADRCYQDNGLLVPRTDSGAVLDQQATLAQVKQLCEQGTVTTNSGNIMPIQADSLCVHGDNPESVKVIAAIRQQVAACT